MNLLQIFFIISGITIFIISFDIAKKQKFNTLHFLVFLWIWIGLLLFSIFPSFLNLIWWFFGLQRGADLLVYSSIIFLIYFVLLLLSEHVNTKDNITDLVRELAIENSEKKEIKWKEVFVIPAYNEYKSVWKVIDSILKNWYKNILIINDGSRDDTRKVLEKYSSKIIVLNHYKNRWQWAALETGFEYIRRYGKVDYVVTFDSDWQHNINDLKVFENYLNKNEKVDILLGSRFLSKKQVWMPFLRKFILKLGILFTFFVSNLKLSDTHNWFRVIRLRVLDKIRITIDGMWHASEIIDIISNEKLVYKEIPITIDYTDYSLNKWQSSSNAIFIALRFIWNKFFR